MSIETKLEEKKKELKKMLEQIEIDTQQEVGFGIKGSAMILGFFANRKDTIETCLLCIETFEEIAKEINREVR